MYLEYVISLHAICVANLSHYPYYFCNFKVSLIVTWANMDDLVSYAEFSDKEEKRIQKKLAKKVNKQ